ncbi:MAG: hypothetical protein V4678_00120 [Patescibacteria group bacterium]
MTLGHLTARPAVVATDYRKVRNLLNRALPYYQLHSNGSHPEAMWNKVKLVVDDDVFTCALFSLIGDTDEPILVVLERILNPGPTTDFIVLQYDESNDNRLMPRQFVYTMNDKDELDIWAVLKELLG